MIDRYTQQVFYHFVLSDLSILNKWEPDFFDDKILRLCFGIAKDYAIRYKTPPSCEAMKNELIGKGESELVNEGVIDSIYSTASTMGGYTEDWIRDHSIAYATWKKMENSLKTTISYVKQHQDNVTIENVKDLTETAKSVFNTNSLISFEDVDNGSDFWDAGSHQTKQMVRSTSGYDFIDTCLDGGYFPGALICLVGAPKVGKSLFLNNLCAESVKRGQHCVYISLELPEEMINQRIGANMFSIPSLEYRSFAKDGASMKKKIESYKKNSLTHPGELRVKFFPTSTASVIDIETYLLKLESEMSTDGAFKFQNVFIDYINIMRNYRNPNSENTYMKIKQLAEDLKAMGAKNKWAIITATQSNRQQFDSEDMGAQDVAESVGLGATVDGMFGIIATPEMKAAGTYYLKCIYDRVAPFDNKRRTYILNKDFLRIFEDPNGGIVDCYEQNMQTATMNAQKINNDAQKMNTQSKENFAEHEKVVSDDHMKDMVPGARENIEPNINFDVNATNFNGNNLFDIQDMSKSSGTIMTSPEVVEKPTVNPIVQTPQINNVGNPPFMSITMDSINDASARGRAILEEQKQTPQITNTPVISINFGTPQTPVDKSEPKNETIIKEEPKPFDTSAIQAPSGPTGGFVSFSNVIVNRTPSYSRPKGVEERDVMGQPAISPITINRDSS